MRKALLVFGIALLLVGIVYRRAPINFLRSESGWYLRTAYSDETTQQNLERGFYRSSYGGHYTPLLFLAEFKITGLIGTNGTIWLVRQLLAVALLAAMIFAVAYRLGTIFELGNGLRIALGTALAAVSVFQPAMLDLIGWPFMILQLIWMGCALFVLYSLTKIAGEPDKKSWIWVSALGAYGSLHVSGLGLVLIAAVTAALSGLLIVAIRSPQSSVGAARRSIAAALSTMLVLTALHGWAMIHFLPPPPSSPPAIHSAGFIALFKILLGFATNFVMAGVETFTRTGFAETNNDSIPYVWPFGLLLLLSTIAFYVWMLRRAKADPTPQKISALLLNAYTVAGLWTLIGLVAARELHFRSVEEMLPQLAHYLSVPRYVGPVHFVLLGSAIYLAVAVSRIGSARYLGARLRRTGPQIGTIIWSGIFLAAVLAQVVHLKAYKKFAPRAAISHTKVWQEILKTVKDCREARLAVPDFPMEVLTQEFAPSNLSSFEPVLRHDLKLENGEINFIPWEDYLGANRERYAKVPRVDRLKQQLVSDQK